MRTLPPRTFKYGLRRSITVTDVPDSRQKPINRRVSERPITHFNDPLELLYAFRDAVASEFTVYVA